MALFCEWDDSPGYGAASAKSVFLKVTQWAVLVSGWQDVML